MRLDGVMLFVKDLDRMTAFYRDVLGLQPVEETRLDNWVEFIGDGARFSLHAIPSAIAAGIRIDSPLRPREQSGTKLTFAVQNVDATLEKIAQMGLPLLRRPWGATEAVDPEGNVFAVSTPPGTAADPLAVARQFNDAFNRHDVDGIMALMTDDCVFENTRPAPDGTRYEGQDAVRTLWRQFFANSPQARFEFTDMFAAGDRCVVHFTYYWVKENVAGHVRGVDILRIREGKVAEKLSYVKG